MKRFWNVSVKNFMKVILCVRSGVCTTLLTVSAYFQSAFVFYLFYLSCFQAGFMKYHNTKKRRIDTFFSLLLATYFVKFVRVNF